MKSLRFKIYEGDSQKVELNVKGEKEVKGSDFKIFPQIELVNPDLHLATITNKKTELNMEITIERGLGYEPKEDRKKKKSEIGVITLDAIFTPIKNVNFHVESMRVGERTDFDKLFLEIETDGTITPEEAFFKSCEILIGHFNSIYDSKKENLQELETEKVEELKTKKTKKVKTKVKSKAKK